MEKAIARRCEFFRRHISKDKISFFFVYFLGKSFSFGGVSWPNSTESGVVILSSNFGGDRAGQYL